MALLINFLLESTGRVNAQSSIASLCVKDSYATQRRNQQIELLKIGGTQSKVVE